jgi:hypothetical protein
MNNCLKAINTIQRNCFNNLLYYWATVACISIIPLFVFGCIQTFII